MLRHKTITFCEFVQLIIQLLFWFRPEQKPNEMPTGIAIPLLEKWCRGENDFGGVNDTLNAKCCLC